jgi:hypothetical protein
MVMATTTRSHVSVAGSARQCIHFHVIALAEQLRAGGDHETKAKARVELGVPLLLRARTCLGARDVRHGQGCRGAQQTVPAGSR